MASPSPVWPSLSCLPPSLACCFLPSHLDIPSVGSWCCIWNGGWVQVEILGHYTDEKENDSEEWTFEVGAKDVPNLDGEDWVPRVPLINTWSGDSNPNNNAFHAWEEIDSLGDNIIFDQRYSDVLPDEIRIRQWGWENDEVYGGSLTVVVGGETMTMSMAQAINPLV